MATLMNSSSAETLPPPSSQTIWLDPNHYVEIAPNQTAFDMQKSEIAINPNLPSGVIKILSSVQFHLTDDPDVVARVITTEEGPIEITFNTRRMLKALESETPLCNHEIEKRTAILTRFLNCKWNHELTHLIDTLDPKILIEIRNRISTLIGPLEIRERLLYAYIATSYGLMLSKTDFDNLLLVSASISVGLAVDDIVRRFYSATFTKHERKAIKAGRQSYNEPLNIPFTVTSYTYET